jgi:hypothetical protein
MDPNSTYLLEIKLLGNPKKVRKDVRCFCFDKVVDSDTTNLKDLVDEITDMYPPGYLEVAHVQYYDADLKSFPVVNTDQGYGHHWPSCKKGNPEDIAALLAVR